MDDRAKNSERYWVIIACAAAALLLGLLVCAQIYFTPRRDGLVHSWAQTVGSELPRMYLWAMLVPIVPWLAYRFPLFHRRWPLAVLVHLTAAGSVVFARTGIESLLFLASVPAGAKVDLPKLITAAFQPRPAADLLLYLGIFGITSPLVYWNRLRERESAAAQLQVQLAQAELHTLRMQLNPHFHLNALNSVATLVRLKRNDDAIDLIAGLGELLRSVLDDSRAVEVPLRTELDLLSRYLSVERVRFSDRLAVEMDVSPGALAALVPSFLLQPIVENAIKHGIARRVEGGLVRISARASDERLALTIENDGPTFELATVPAGTPGIGIQNIKDRLRRMYGTQAEFSLSNLPQGRVLATVLLPLKMAVPRSARG